MRREIKDGLSRQLIESRIPETVDVIRQYIAATPLNTPLPGLPAILHLAGETTSAIVAQSSTREYTDDVRVVLRDAVTRGFLPTPRLPKTPRLRRALREYAIDGLANTIPLHQRILEHPDFAAGQYDVHWLERELMSRENP